MSEQFKIPAFRDRNATIIQGVPILDPSKLKVKNNIGQESLGEVYTAEFLESGQHFIERVVIKKAIHTLAHDFNLILLVSFLGPIFLDTHVIGRILTTSSRKKVARQNFWPPICQNACFYLVLHIIIMVINLFKQNFYSTFVPRTQGAYY